MCRRSVNGEDNIWMDQRANILGIQMLIGLNITLDSKRIFQSALSREGESDTKLY